MLKGFFKYALYTVLTAAADTLQLSQPVLFARIMSLCDMCVGNRGIEPAGNYVVQ